ncbi:MAG: hypothetical protein LUC83_09310 [Clostridiales bacterium]|nr:hypothetical protein [Clostridiales bacterium]
MSDVFNGDIWTLQKQSGTICEVLILAKHDRYATILTLNDREPSENPVKVNSKCIMYTDAGKIGYAFYDTLCDFVKTLPDGEFTKIMNKVGAALGMDAFKTPTTAPEPSKKPEPIPAPKPAETPHTGTEKPFTVVDRDNYRKLQLEYAAVRRECAVYKEMLYNALPQLGGKNGADSQENTK